MRRAGLWPQGRGSSRGPPGWPPPPPWGCRRGGLRMRRLACGARTRRLLAWLRRGARRLLMRCAAGRGASWRGCGAGRGASCAAAAPDAAPPAAAAPRDAAPPRAGLDAALPGAAAQPGMRRLGTRRPGVAPPARRIGARAAPGLPPPARGASPGRAPPALGPPGAARRLVGAPGRWSPGRWSRALVGRALVARALVTRARSSGLLAPALPCCRPGARLLAGLARPCARGRAVRAAPPASGPARAPRPGRPSGPRGPFAGPGAPGRCSFTGAPGSPGRAPGGRRPGMPTGPGCPAFGSPGRPAAPHLAPHLAPLPAPLLAGRRSIRRAAARWARPGGLPGPAPGRPAAPGAFTGRSAGVPARPALNSSARSLRAGRRLTPGERHAEPSRRPLGQAEGLGRRPHRVARDEGPRLFELARHRHAAATGPGREPTIAAAGIIVDPPRIRHAPDRLVRLEAAAVVVVHHHVHVRDLADVDVPHIGRARAVPRIIGLPRPERHPAHRAARQRRPERHARADRDGPTPKKLTSAGA